MKGRAPLSPIVVGKLLGTPRSSVTRNGKLAVDDSLSTVPDTFVYVTIRSFMSQHSPGQEWYTKRWSDEHVANDRPRRGSVSENVSVPDIARTR